jgi:hypothetical protein
MHGRVAGVGWQPAQIARLASESASFALPGIPRLERRRRGIGVITAEV